MGKLDQVKRSFRLRLRDGPVLVLWNHESSDCGVGWLRKALFREDKCMEQEFINTTLLAAKT